MDNQKYTPKNILFTAFGDQVGILPISGGWGRTKEQAVVIHVDKTHEGINVENIFIKYSTYIEFIVGVRNKNEKLTKIEFLNKSQTLINLENKTYDKVEFTIKGLKNIDYCLLKSELNESKNNKNFNLKNFTQKKEDKAVYIKREFWFDISAFFGK